MNKFSEENIRRWMFPHIHIRKGNVRIYKTLGLVDFKTLKHGDKAGKGIFRLMEEDLYEDEFYKTALPIAKRIWEQEK